MRIQEWLRGHRQSYLVSQSNAKALGRNTQIVVDSVYYLW